MTMIQTLSVDNPEFNIQLVHQISDEVYSDNKLLSQLSTVQAILEGAINRKPPSVLAYKYNNLFGIKGQGTGLVINDKVITTISLSTHEYYDGQMHVVNQEFAVNANLIDSIKQHKKLLELPRYYLLANCESFEKIAHEIYRAGYATDINYPAELIDVYNKYVKNL